MGYLIAMEHDDSLASEFDIGDDDEAEARLASLSKSRPGSMLLFRDGRLMAHARDGDVFSYRPDAERRVVAA